MVTSYAGLTRVCIDLRTFNRWIAGSSSVRGRASGRARWRRRYFKEQRLLERRQIVFDRPPDNRGINALVVVPQNVADTGDIRPAHGLVLRFQVAAEVATGF
jgi:hypothetical protein